LNSEYFEEITDLFLKLNELLKQFYYFYKKKNMVKLKLLDIALFEIYENLKNYNLVNGILIRS
jgi:hypothetical protein